MVFWKTAPASQVATTAASAGMDHSEEMLAEVDEPPDERNNKPFWQPPKLNTDYMRSAPRMTPRRESLLTRQLHSETEHSDEDHTLPPLRALSTQSTWSNPSTASTAELTSDDGRSMPSPAISPPLPPTQLRSPVAPEKLLEKHVTIVGQDDMAASPVSKEPEKTVEATLGRKRCIMFACRGKEEAKAKAPSPPPTSTPAAEQPTPASPPKRRCAIKFACPKRADAEAKVVEQAAFKRPASPAPMLRKPSQTKASPTKTHRGSDSTVTHVSPKNVRKSPNITTTAPTPTTPDTPKPAMLRKQSEDSDGSGPAATRFHEFASSDDEPEEWVRESTCHRSRLTIGDTLQKENVIRKACEEAEEEAVEEEDDVEDEVEEADADGDEQDDGEPDDEDDESEGSDAGFHSDDEQGFADSDDEGGDSDYEWWRPGGSTAATSVEHLDRLTIQPLSKGTAMPSSLGSASSGHLSPHASKRPNHHRVRKTTRTAAIEIDSRANDADLPDSTDFVCGTLDEDRPLEQAYLDRKKDLEAAKHKARPQDIDPTFPTSDPEMDEEDDEDIEDPEESENENLMHGDLDEVDEGQHTLRRMLSARRQARSKVHRSPPPTSRYHSPPPTKRLPKPHSPPPPMARRGTARSPPPRKLFGQSPSRARSPAPINRTTSPPNTRHASPTNAEAFRKASQGLAQRTQLTHTASLPRNGGFLLSRMGRKHFDDADGSDTVGAANTDIPKRGAIDIVKGLERKRQRRKEKMWQKMCAKNAAKGEKPYKVKPGKGAERMREVGLELQKYHGKGEHILSV